MLGGADNYCNLLYGAIEAAGGDSATLRRRLAAAHPIRLEEAIDCRLGANSRLFSLSNAHSKLTVIVSVNSALVSCQLAGHEILVDGLRQLRQTHKTWALGSRPYQKLEALPWQCHVRGDQLLLSTASQGVSSLLYELNRHDELHCQAKLKSLHLQHRAAYFNLNSAKDKALIDGHLLRVECNGSSERIRHQNTKLLCRCNQAAPLQAQQLLAEEPCRLVSGQVPNLEQLPEDDLIVCDSTFSLEAGSPSDYLRVRLQFGRRVLEFELRSSQAQPQPTQLVAGHLPPPPPPHPPAASSTTATTTASVSSSAAATTAGTLKLALRVRVRVTNFGVCIMPVSMSSYASLYRFAW